MNLLVTGSRGFLGQYLYHKSVFDSYDVVFGTTSNSSEKGYKKFSNYYDNALGLLKDRQLDAIIHLAAEIPSSFESADFSLFENNTRMMKNILNLAIEKKVSKVIYLSTFGSMLNPAECDVKDYYTSSKIAGEHFCSILESKGIQTASLRIPSPYGEYNTRANVIQIFSDLALTGNTINVYGSGKRFQNFIYAGDIAGCIKKSLNVDTSGVYGLINPKNTSMLELAQLIVRILNSSSKIIVGNKPDPLEDSISVNYNQIKSVTDMGYQHQFTLEQGLSNYLSWRKGLQE